MRTQLNGLGEGNYGSLISIVVLLILFSTANAQTYKTVVKGRIVDIEGNPVSRAIVSLESDGNEQIDVVSDSETVYTDASGRFAVENISVKAKRERNLFVSGPFPENAIGLVDIPPTKSMLRLMPGLRIRSVDLDKSTSVDLGDLEMKIGMQLVEVALLTSGGEPFYDTADAWNSGCYVLRGKDGRPYIARGISTRDTELRINVEKGSIRFAIPEGIWSIDFVEDLGKLDEILATTDRFRVRHSGAPSRISVRVTGSVKK